MYFKNTEFRKVVMGTKFFFKQRILAFLMVQNLLNKVRNLLEGIHKSIRQNILNHGSKNN